MFEDSLFMKNLQLFKIYCSERNYNRAKFIVAQNLLSHKIYCHTKSTTAKNIPVSSWWQ